MSEDNYSSKIENWVANSAPISMDCLNQEDLENLRKRLVLQSQKSEVECQIPTDPCFRDFEFLEPIQEGGMGVVWKARQTHPIDRVVAIKVVRPGLERHNHRIRLESQALAALTHPNIAQIYDAGETTNGRCYIVMEYVPGTDVCSFAEQYQLGLSQRLELFASLCHAVEACHVKGVIHRDIKPSNVMVVDQDFLQTGNSSSPVVKLIDFGLTKTSAAWQGPKSREETAELIVLGSPFWMSPEQAKGVMTGKDVDHRTDIYSLGALLYQLITSSPPLDFETYESKSDLEVINAVQHEETERPSRRVRGLIHSNKINDANSSVATFLFDSDLDAITLMALEKEPDRRYQSAADFADDINRYLEKRPVKAKSPAQVYLLKKWVIRNRVKAFSGLAITVTVVAATLAVFLQKSVTIRAEQNSQRLAFAAAKEAKAAEEERRSVARERDRNLTLSKDLEWMNQQYLNSLDRMYRFSHDYSALNKDPEHLERVSKRLFIGPLSDERRLLMANKIARIWASYDEWERGRGVMLDCLSEIENPAGVQKFRADCFLASCELNLGDPQAGLKSLKSTILEYEKSENPEQEIIINQKGLLAAAYFEKGQYENALSLAESVIREIRLQGLTAPKGELNSLCVLSMVYDRLGFFDKAIETCKKAMEFELQDISKEVIQLTCGGNLLDIYKNAGEYRKAHDLAGVLLELSITRNGVDDWQTLELRKAQSAIGYLLGDKANALKALKETHDTAVAKLGERHPLSLNISSDLALLYSQNQAYQKAIQICEKNIPLSNEVFGEQHLASMKLRNIFGFSLASSGRLNEGVSEMERSLRSAIENNVLPSLTQLSTLQHFVFFGLQADRFAECCDLISDYIEYLGGETPDASQLVCNVECRLLYAKMALNIGDFKRCESLCNAIKKTDGLSETQNQVSVFLLLAECLIACGRFDEAAETIDQILGEQTNRPVPPNIRIAARLLLVEVMLSRREFYKARFTLDRIRETTNEVFGEPNLYGYQITDLYGQIHFQEGNLSEAENCFLATFAVLRDFNRRMSTYDWRLANAVQRLAEISRKKSEFESANHWNGIALELEGLRKRLLEKNYFD